MRLSTRGAFGWFRLRPKFRSLEARMVNWWWVRHGPTNRTEMNGWTDVPADLSDTAALARLSALLPAGAPVISSDLARAVATADAIAAGRPRLPHDRDLREIHFGAWEARRVAEIEAEDGALLRRYLEAPGDVAPPGGETWNTLAARVDAAVDRLTGMAGDVIAVAHFGPILSQVQRATGSPAAEVFTREIAPLSVTRIVLDRGWRLAGLNRLP
jgi:broad specificity phosphatase PhoE